MDQSATQVCHYCKKPGDLRPYGPKGAPICHPCMKADPKREAEAKKQVHAAFNAAGPIAIIDGKGPPRAPRRGDFGD